MIVTQNSAPALHSASRYRGSTSDSFPWAFSRTARLFIEVNVLGWSLPKTRRLPSSASRYSGFASDSLPWLLSRIARLLVELSASSSSSSSIQLCGRKVAGGTGRRGWPPTRAP